MSVLSPFRRRALAAALFAAICVFPGGRARAAGAITLHVDSETGAGWQASDITVRLLAAPPGLALEIDVGALVLPPPIGRIENAHIKCPRFSVEAGVVACPAAQVHLRSDYLDAPDFSAAVRYDLDNHRLSLRADDVEVLGSHASVSVKSADIGWTARLRAQQVDAAPLVALAKRLSVPLGGYSAGAGRLDVDATVTLQHNRLATVDGELTATGLTLNNADGTVATAKLGAALAFHARAAGAGWRFKVQVDARAGQAYAEPIFMDLQAHPGTVAATGSWQPQGRRLHIEQFSIDQPGVLKAAGAVDAAMTQPLSIASGAMTIAEADFPAAYDSYLRPLLVGTPLDSLTTGGRLQAKLVIDDNRPRLLDAVLTDIDIHDQQQRFALNDLTGDLHWRAKGDAPATTLRWRGGELLHFALGPSELALQASGNNVRLLKPLHLPVFDGALEISRLAVTHAGTPQVSVDFNGRLMPTSMTRVSTALGWPALAGTLSGTLPSLSYRDHVLAFGGALQAKVFGGSVAVQGFRLEHPFGVAPELFGTLRLRNIDLAKLTGAFSFGSITGRLNGDIVDLRLVDWRAAGFDARFYTPPDDRSKHRISQQALNNISSIGGGGATAALSRGFMSLFSSFAYSRIGISCRLQRDVCLMSGLKPAPNNGYYIVQGAGLPRVDVIGYTHQVNWPVLVKEVKNAAKAKHPVVK